MNASCKSNHSRQDPDVLDTWFSSDFWPFSTLVSWENGDAFKNEKWFESDLKDFLP